MVCLNKYSHWLFDGDFVKDETQHRDTLFDFVEDETHSIRIHYLMRYTNADLSIEIGSSIQKSLSF